MFFLLLLLFQKVKPTTICLCWGLKHGQKTRPFNDAEKDKGQRKEKYIIIGESSHWTSVPQGKLITKHEDGTGKMGGGGDRKAKSAAPIAWANLWNSGSLLAAQLHTTCWVLSQERGQHVAGE